MYSLSDSTLLMWCFRNRSYHSQRNNTREPRYGQDSDRRDSGRQDSDRTSSRADRPGSRNDQGGHYRYDRPSSRTDGYSRDDIYHRHRGYYRDYVDSSFDERYDRPRSRQGQIFFFLILKYVYIFLMKDMAFIFISNRTFSHLKIVFEVS